MQILTNRRVVRGLGSRNHRQWAWEYQGRFQGGSLFKLLTENETRDSLSPLQLDVCHALRKLWTEHTGKSPRAPGVPTRGEREVECRPTRVTCGQNQWDGNLLIREGGRNGARFATSIIHTGERCTKTAIGRYSQGGNMIAVVHTCRNPPRFQNCGLRTVKDVVLGRSGSRRALQAVGGGVRLEKNTRGTGDKRDVVKI